MLSVKNQMPKLWMLWYLVMVASFVRAETPVSSTSDPANSDAAAKVSTHTQAFWDYFIEYGGGRGELFDPVDFAEVEQLKVRQSGPNEDREERHP